MISSDKDRPILAYCANCDREYRCGEGLSRLHIGALFLCPTDRTHLAQIVSGKTGKYWLRWRKRFMLYEHRYSAFALLRKWPWSSAWFSDAGPFLVMRFVVLAVMLLPSAAESVQWRAAASIVAAYLLIDLLLANIAVAFVTRGPADPFRSVLFALFSFVQITMAFAVFYSSLWPSFVPINGGSGSPQRIGSVDALYFSWLIATTIGWGDIAPFNQRLLVKLIVSSQLFTSLLFLVTVLQVMVSWSDRKSAEPAKDLDELIGQKDEH